jgi:hypothetical protein
MLRTKDALFVILLLGRNGIGFTALVIALWLNLRWMTVNDVDWRMRWSWCGLLSFAAGVLADTWSSRFYPVMTPHHTAELARLEFACFLFAFIFSVMGRGAGRAAIGITSIALGWLFIGTAFK